MNDFTSGNASKQIILFALPMLLGNIFQQIYSMTDYIIVGQYVSGSALAAVGTSSTIINFIISVLIGLTTGASVVISQFFGAKKEEDLKRTVSTSMVFMAVLSVSLSLLGYILSPVFLRLMGVQADIFNDALTYIRVIMAGMTFPIFYNIYTAYMRALGDSRNPLYILIFSTVVNIGLDYLFVAVFRMGVFGAALATIVAQSLSAFLCIFYAYKFMPLLAVKKLVFDFRLFKLVLRYSIPAAIQLSMTSLASLTIMRLVNGFGSVAVAGFTSATKIDSFATMPLANVSMALSTFVGQNMGAGLESRAKGGFRSTLVFMLLVGVVVSTLAIVFGKALIGLFVSPADPDYTEIIRIGSQYLSIISSFYILFGIFFAFNGFFRGAGDAVIVMILTITSLSIRAVSAHVLVARFDMGPEAVAWSIPIGWALCSAFAFFYYKKRLWAGKAAVKPQDIQ